MTAGSHTPRTFQTPNVVADRLMYFLTDQELRVVLFTARHTLGWPNADEYPLSISSYEQGHRGQTGCGLSRPAIVKAIKALVSFNILQPGKRTHKGQGWTLNESQMYQWDKLAERQEAQKAKTRQKTAKATEASINKRKAASGTSHVPAISTSHVPEQGDPDGASGTSHVPAISTSHVPEGGTSHVRIETHIETQSLETQKTPSPQGDETVTPSQTVEELPTVDPPASSRQPTLQQQLFGAFKRVLKMAPEAEVAEDSLIGRHAKWLSGQAVLASRAKDAPRVPGCNPPATPQQVEAFLEEWILKRGLSLSPQSVVFADNWYGWLPTYEPPVEPDKPVDLSAPEWQGVEVIRLQSETLEEMMERARLTVKAGRAITRSEMQDYAD